MNRTIGLITLIVLAVSGCQWYESDPPPPADNPKFNVLRATTDEEDLGDLTLFCIDGITYVAIPGIGMSVKYTLAGFKEDPVIETCTNHTPPNKKRIKQ